MNVTFIRQWIAALRSGEYEQIKGVHQDFDGKFCVLGLGYVLCPGHWWFPYALSGFLAGDCQIAPGLLVQNSGLSKETLLYMALHLNDAGKTFLEIADYLEAMLPKETFAQELYEKILTENHDTVEV